MTDHIFLLFPAKRSINLFDMTVNNELSFGEYISNLYKKINNQFNVQLQKDFAS